MAFIPLPDGLTFEEWSAVVVEQYADQGIPEYYPTEVEWASWGQRLQEIDELAYLPDTAGFAEWRAWAMRVYELLTG